MQTKRKVSSERPEKNLRQAPKLHNPDLSNIYRTRQLHRDGEYSCCVTGLGSPIRRSRCSQIKSNGTYYPLVNINLKTHSPGIPILPLFTNRPFYGPGPFRPYNIFLCFSSHFIQVIKNGPSLFIYEK